MANLPLGEFCNKLPFPLSGNNQPPIIIGSPNTYLHQVSLNLRNFCSLLIYFAACLSHMYWCILTECWNSVKHSKQPQIRQPHSTIEIIIIKDFVHMPLPLTDSQFRWLYLLEALFYFDNYEIPSASWPFNWLIHTGSWTSAHSGPV